MLIQAQRTLRLLVVPLAIMVTIIGTVAGIGIETFESMLLDKNPLVLASVSAFIGTLIFSFHRLSVRLQ
jgi:hypothetical protein